MRKLARAHLNSLGVNIPDVNAEVATLSGGQRQAIAVARSVFSDAKIILLDEPLAAMGAKEGGLILKLIRELRERGDVSQIVIAHNYLHVLETCDRVCLLQNGRITFDRPTAETSVEELLDARRRGVPRPRRVSRGAATAAPPAAARIAGLAEHVYQLLKAEVINDQFGAGRAHRDRVGRATSRRQPDAGARGARAPGGRAARRRSASTSATSALPPLSLAELRDLFEAREVIECAGAVRACERSTDDDLARLREIDAHIRAGHYGKERYSEFAAFVNDNQRFHETLLDAARNPELRRAFDALNYEARIARRTRGRGVPDLDLICQEHAAIIDGAGGARRTERSWPRSPATPARATSGWPTTSRDARV